MISREVGKSKTSITGKWLEISQAKILNLGKHHIIGQNTELAVRGS